MNRRLSTAVVASLILLLVASVTQAREFERTFTFDNNDLKVVNMIGAVKVVAADGSDFQITVTVRGEDATEDFLEMESLDVDGDVLAIRFPTDDHSNYVYPEMGRNSKTTIQFRDESDNGKSWLKQVFSGLTGKRITVRGKGRGKEVWADVVVAVPREAYLEVRQGVGTITANDLAADLNLDINAGGIEVRQVRGDVLADTGSGSVTAVGINGEVNIDTGSGRVDVSDCQSNDIKVDTGSGRVVAEDLKCEYLLVDTGSGSVKARRVKTDRATIDTGSGSVLLQLDRMGDGKFVIDTGSGGIELIMPDGASAHIVADTGSGSVSNDYDGAETVHKGRNEMELMVGDGDARVRLDAGSGSIRVR